VQWNTSVKFSRPTQNVTNQKTCIVSLVLVKVSFGEKIGSLGPLTIFNPFLGR